MSSEQALCRRIFFRTGLQTALGLAVCLLVFAFCSSAGRAEEPAFREYQVKALFLYNFSMFVSWPDDAFDGPNAPFNLCILGEDPFGDVIDKVVRGESVGGRALRIVRQAHPGDSGGCHILFVASSERERLGKILAALENRRVLTVGDTADFARSGGMITLSRKGNRIHPEINVQAARKAGLAVSSKLLKLSTIVEGGEPEVRR